MTDEVHRRALADWHGSRFYRDFLGVVLANCINAQGSGDRPGLWPKGFCHAHESYLAPSCIGDPPTQGCQPFGYETCVKQRLLQKRRYVETIIVTEGIVATEQLLEPASLWLAPTVASTARSGFHTIKSGSNHRDTNLIVQFIVNCSTKDDVGVLMGDAVDNLRCGIQLEQTHV
jgi:hypothetical protein